MPTHEENTKAFSRNRHPELQSRRKETIERVFFGAKEGHGKQWITLRGLEKMSMKAILTFTVMNLKKLATWTWQGAWKLTIKTIPNAFRSFPKIKTS
nr:transposase [Mesobacillus harenae]